MLQLLQYVKLKLRKPRVVVSVIIKGRGPTELAVSRTLHHRVLSCVILAASLIFNPVLTDILNPSLSLSAS